MSMSTVRERELQEQQAISQLSFQSWYKSTSNRSTLPLSITLNLVNDIFLIIYILSSRAFAMQRMSIKVQTDCPGRHTFAVTFRSASVEFRLEWADWALVSHRPASVHLGVRGRARGCRPDDRYCNALEQLWSLAHVCFVRPGPFPTRASYTYKIQASRPYCLYWELPIFSHTVCEFQS